MTLAEGSAADLERAIAREVELWEAFRRRDRAALERLVDPLALDVGPWGALERDAMLAAVARMEIASYEIDDFRLRSAPGVEVVCYRATVDGTYGGAPFVAREVAATSVWSRGGSGWTLVHRHEAQLDRRR